MGYLKLVLHSYLVKPPVLLCTKYNLHAVLKWDLPFSPIHEALEKHGIILLAANVKTNPNELHSQQEKGKNSVWCFQGFVQPEAEANVWLFQRADLQISSVYWFKIYNSAFV